MSTSGHNSKIDIKDAPLYNKGTNPSSGKANDPMRWPDKGTLHGPGSH